MRKARRRSTEARANGSRDKQIVKTTEASWKQYSGHQSLLAFCWISHKLWESRRRTKCVWRIDHKISCIATNDNLDKWLGPTWWWRKTVCCVTRWDSCLPHLRRNDRGRRITQEVSTKKKKKKKTMTEINSDRKRNDHGCRIYTKRRSASPIWMFMCGAIKYKTKGLVQCNE